MANNTDGTEGCKHNTYEVVLRFTDIQADSPSKAVEKIVEWIKDGVSEMIFEVVDEETKEEYIIDLDDANGEEVKD